jgi:hypothetical protein
MKKQRTWEDNSILRIKREFSQTEKYSILVKKYQEMEDKIEVYKKQIATLQNSCSVYKTQYSKLEFKYIDVCKKHQIEEHAPIDKL